jgi:hypothetical protein
MTDFNRTPRHPNYKAAIPSAKIHDDQADRDFANARGIAGNKRGTVTGVPTERELANARGIAGRPRNHTP